MEESFIDLIHKAYLAAIISSQKVCPMPVNTGTGKRLHNSQVQFIRTAIISNTVDTFLSAASGFQLKGSSWLCRKAVNFLPSSLMGIVLFIDKLAISFHPYITGIVLFLLLLLFRVSNVNAGTMSNIVSTTCGASNINDGNECALATNTVTVTVTATVTSVSLRTISNADWSCGDCASSTHTESSCSTLPALPI